MALKRGTLWLRAAFTILLSLLFFVGEGVTIYAIIADGGVSGGSFFTSFGFFFVFVGFFILLINLIILLVPVMVVAQLRVAARGRDPQGSTMATMQPDPTLTLRDGETITLERRRTARSIAQSVILLPLLFLLLAAVCEAGIFAAIPAFGRSALNPLYDALLDGNSAAPPIATPFDWIAATFPLVVFGLLAMVVPINVLTTRRERITADDRGITAGRKFIPWNDIQLFLRGYTADPKFTGGYWVWGREHSIVSFTIHPRRATTVGQTSQTSEEFLFTNGYEAYERDAQRLLATIVARGYQPLRMSLAGSRTITRLQRRLPELATTAGQAEAAPLAEPSWQPPTNPTITNFDVRLQPRIDGGRYVLWTIVITAILLGLFFVFGVYKTSAYSASDGTGSLLFWIGFGVSVAIAVPIAAVLAFVHQRGRRPVIAADAKGVARQTQSSSSTVTIPWTEVRAWGVLPPRVGTTDAPRYFVFGEVGKFSWMEPADAVMGGRVNGDRRAAYVERAAELHALIFARTGLPLHDLTSIIAPTPQNVMDLSTVSASDVLRS